MNKFYFLSFLLLSSCSPKLFLTVNNIKDNYISFINNKNLKPYTNLFLTEKERKELSVINGVDTSDLINCPISKNPNDLVQYINECIGFEKELNDKVEYSLIVTKTTTNNKCTDLKVEFIYCDVLENKKATNKHVILFIVLVNKNKSYKLFGHKYYEDI